MERFFGDVDRYLFHNGTHYEIYNKMGAHVREENGVWGVRFVLWAPNARAVCVVHDGNGWTRWADNMEKFEDGVWELFIPNMPEGTRYKYHIVRADGSEVDKVDPYGMGSEVRPSNASKIVNLRRFTWTDDEYMENRRKQNFLEKPMAVYEVHLGSWKKDTWKNDEDQFLDYRRLAHEIYDYIAYMGYTHVELMGICEYPFDPSWGYQVTGYYCPTSRYGAPTDFMYFINYMHEHGIGVILDWVPAHFPKDEFSLGNFDGTPLYEYADPLRAEYPEWGTKAFDHGKKEVANFLMGSAFFWVEKYHIDALRVDAVAAMLYRSFAREHFRPAPDGSNLSYESFEFFRHLTNVLRDRTGAILIAEDSSTIGGITASPDYGGLGFGLKWNMGWMNDTLRYIELDPIYRKYHHNLMTHTLDYVFNENFILVLSHDEVVYGKGSMYGKMPGNKMDKCGSLKSYYTMMMGHPGKKLLFMGQDFAQENEWNFKASLDWHLCDDPAHHDVMDCYRELLKIYRERRVLHDDSGRNTFEWIDGGDAERSIFSFMRRNPWNYNNALIFVCNMTPVEYDYAVGVPVLGKYKRIFSTYPDGNLMEVEAQMCLCNGRPYKVPFRLRAYESVILEVPCYDMPASAAEPEMPEVEPVVEVKLSETEPVVIKAAVEGKKTEPEAKENGAKKVTIKVKKSAKE